MLPGSRRCVLLILLSLLSFCSHAKDTILWGVGNQPPRITFDGHKRVGGQGGIQQELLVTGLADKYDHQYVAMNWARFEKEVLAEKFVCSAFVVKTTAREEHMAFSLPLHIDLPHRLVINKKAWQLLGEPAEVSLSELLLDNRISGVIGKGRSYDVLDTTLNKIRAYSNLQVLSVRPLKIQAMLDKERIDYTIELPYFYEFLRKQRRSEGIELI